LSTTGPHASCVASAEKNGRSKQIVGDIGQSSPADVRKDGFTNQSCKVHSGVKGIDMGFQYKIKAHPTMYNGVQYRSRLEARWAAFFDLIGWQHEYEPIDLPGWSPDFRVVFPCGHSECSGSHSLLVEVKPYFRIEQFKGHPCMDYPYGYNSCHIPSGVSDLPKEDQDRIWKEISIPADASAAFGANPEITYWEMSHGAGGGEDNLLFWIEHLPYSRLWSEAGNRVQWHPKQLEKRDALNDQVIRGMRKND
jgi:hypothetical protein